MRRVNRVLALGVAIGLVLAPAAGARPIDKLGSQLRDLVRGKHVRAKPARRAVQLLPISARGGKVLVDVYVHGAIRQGAKAMRADGMRVAAVSTRAPERMVEGWVPVSALDEVAALRRTRAVLPVHPALPLDAPQLRWRPSSSVP